MNCLIVINQMSGNTQKIDEQQLIEKFTALNDHVHITHLSNKNMNWSAVGYDKIIVCGGDGTLNHAINNCQDTTVRQLVYIASGTFNEVSQTTRLQSKLGKLGDELFSYVAAAGSFTEIGYSTKQKDKQRHKIFAYFKKVFQSYRVHNFGAQVDFNNKVVRDKLTLLMFLNSNRCFGFKFNKMYKKNNKKMYILMVKSYGKNTLWNRIRLFFPMFRIFFLGIRKPIYSKRIIFDEFEKATVSLDVPKPFAIDGEKYIASGRFTVQPTHPGYILNIYKAEDVFEQKKY